MKKYLATGLAALMAAAALATPACKKQETGATTPKPNETQSVQTGDTTPDTAITPGNQVNTTNNPGNSLPYNANDMSKIAAFLEQEDDKGVKNGSKFGEKYSPNDPTTWGTYAFKWEEFNGELRLAELSLSMGGFSGMLDVTDCTELRVLDISFNTEVSGVKLSGNEKLETVNCGMTQAGNIDFSCLSSVKYLIIAGSGEEGHIDLSHMTELERFQCYGLAEIDFSSNTKLKVINIQGSYNRKLEALDVTMLPELEKLVCEKNSIKELDLSNNPKLYELDCRENALTELDVSACSDLQNLYCSKNKLTSLVLNPALVYLSCDENELPELDVSPCTALNDLLCHQNKLSQLDLSKNVSLNRLSCGNNPLSKLDLSANAELTDLACSECELTELNVSRNTKLTDIVCGYNKLTSLDVSANTELKRLVCMNNELTVLDVSANTALVDLSCTWNKLTSLILSSHPELKELNCEKNQLNSIDVTNCPVLTRILADHFCEIIK